MITITKYNDIPKALGLHTVAKIMPTLADAVVNNQKLEDVFSASTDFVFITQELTAPKPHSEEVNGKTVEYTIDPSESIDLKDLVDNNFDDVAIANELTTNTEITEYNLNEEDKADLVKKSKSYATNLLKKAAKLFGIYLHEEFMGNYGMTVEVWFSGSIFRILGYYYTDAEGVRGKVAYMDDETFVEKLQAETKWMKKAGDKSESINNDYKSVEGTDYAAKVSGHIKTMMPQINTFGKKLAAFARGVKGIKAAAPATKTAPSGTVASSEVDESGATVKGAAK